MKKITVSDSHEYCIGECYRLQSSSLELIESFFSYFGELEYRNGTFGVNFRADGYHLLLTVDKRQELASIIVSSEIPDLTRGTLNAYSSAFNLVPIRPENSDLEQQTNSMLMGAFLLKLQESRACDGPIN